jgi:hypothetical protein
MASEVFEAQVALLVRVLPHVATKTCFALKGGTTINLFVRELLKSRRRTIRAASRERRLAVKAFLNADGITLLNSLRRVGRSRIAHRI